MEQDVRALSLGQQSLWLFHNLVPESTAYNEASAASFSPWPDIPTLERAVSAVADRHELLRSKFTELEGRPVRIVCAADLVRLEVRWLPDGEDARAAARAVAARPFALTDTGAFRVVLLLREHEAVLVVVIHHIASDALSQRLVWRDLIEAYRASRLDVEPDWPALSGRFDDYVAKERALLDSPRGIELRRYWEKICDGAEAAVLPTDRPRPTRPAFAGATHRATLPEELVRLVHTAAGGLGATPFAVLLGVFQALIFRYTGQHDFTVGCPASVRRTRSLREVVGLLVNPIVLRAGFGGATTFAETIAEAGGQLGAATFRAGYPFALLAADRAADDPLFRIAITMVKPQHDDRLPAIAGGRINVAGHLLERVDLPHLEGQFDLSLEITHSPGSLTTEFRYDVELFEPATIERLAGHFLRLISVACAEPDSVVAKAPMIDHAEQRRLLALGTGTETLA
ncbi:hypothetical protein DMC61_21900 [Amycolatopsis sp. WAC 04169]|uniref:condensation domain-containing protein n=1 Tax=Amycolatopsis sp. WAC 04169 TaxID=2203197 RepID=UPI000F76E915|nr:condensation domain-containing protein [Amycolatopsis sp. WAC 04169]RSN29157.1 hypothetical protein DMC61_21900 [Amycolatopsis sp. WAC 04169]